jgi:hypothetical protein
MHGADGLGYGQRTVAYMVNFAGAVVVVHAGALRQYQTRLAAKSHLV